MSDPLLTIRNHHVPSAGDPPIVGDDENAYVGYFENVHGEQWIFTFDRLTGDAVLRGGDVGWNSENRVIDGVVPGLILSAEEQLWLRSCWAAATGNR